MESKTLDGSSQHLPVSVLTGFSGSGKTAVLNHLLQQQPALNRVVVLIEEQPAEAATG